MGSSWRRPSGTPSNTVACRVPAKLLNSSGRFSRAVRTARALVLVMGSVPMACSFSGMMNFRNLSCPVSARTATSSGLALKRLATCSPRRAKLAGSVGRASLASSSTRCPRSVASCSLISIPQSGPPAHHYSQSAAGHCDDFAANAAKRHLENKKRSTYTEESAREDHALCSRMGQRWPSRRSDLTRFHRRPHRRGEVVQHHMAIHGASISAAGVRPDHSFFWRKLHSFTGIFPVGAFLAEHFWSNSYALVSVAKYNEASGELQTIPGRIFV